MELQLTDLRYITRRSDTRRTEVTVHLDWDTKFKWLVMGECNLRHNESQTEKIRHWWLDAKMDGGVTDFEHDSASAVRLPLVAVTFGQVFNHRVSVHALVAPNNDFHEDFHVPLPGYNPKQHKDTVKCERCKDRPHLIVPEGFYVPPFNEELYKLVAGKEVDIYIGQPYEDDG